jgi:hypothetical protein
MKRLALIGIMLIAAGCSSGVTSQESRDSYTKQYKENLIIVRTDSGDTCYVLAGYAESMSCVR